MKHASLKSSGSRRSFAARPLATPGIVDLLRRSYPKIARPLFQSRPHVFPVHWRAEAGEMMAKEFTPDGRNISPPLTWSNLPAATKQIAVVCEDFDAGNPPPWVHWIIYNIPATATGLPANLPIDPAVPMPRELAGAVQGYNGWRRAMYRGPAPPAGKPHRYHFVVYALDAELNLPARLTRAELHEAMKGHVIGQGELVPVYERKPLAPAQQN
jgi:Raf kinase inhibitor-like YbhB/YbcL family protein